MTDDPRCCGSGTCIIDAEGRCWCGQRWNGETMCHEPSTTEVEPADPPSQAKAPAAAAASADGPRP